MVTWPNQTKIDPYIYEYNICVHICEYNNCEYNIYEYNICVKLTLK